MCDFIAGRGDVDDVPYWNLEGILLLHALLSLGLRVLDNVLATYHVNRVTNGPIPRRAYLNTVSMNSETHSFGYSHAARSLNHPR